MNSTIEMPITYIITALQGEERVYYALDQQSGGYPYWTSFFFSAEKFHDLEKAAAAHKEAVRPDGYMNNGVQQIRLGTLKMAISLGEITEEEILEDRKRKALERIPEEDRRLLGL